jgi:hypothetical protein
MRMQTSLVQGGLRAAATAAVTPTQDGTARAAEIVALARKALGGEETLSAVTSLSLRGTYLRELSAPGGGGGMMIVTMGPGGPGGGRATGEIEIDVALPDKYIRVDNGTGAIAMTRTEGFEGDRSFLDVSSSLPGVRLMTGPPPSDDAMKRATLRRLQGDISRLMLGMLATTPASFPVTFAYGGVAESPDGKADILDVAGPEGFAARLFVDTASHLPLMLSYQAPEPRVVMRTMTGGPPTAGGPEGRPGRLTESQRAERARAAKAAGDEPPTMIQYQVFFSDFREVSGVRLPHHISRGTAGQTTEEWEIRSYRVNPTLKAERFKVGS